MMFKNDITEYICNLLCIYYYSDCDIYKFINKEFSKNIKKHLDKLNNVKHNILMATHIKSWRYELSQTPYIYDEFIIFDNFKYVNKWMDEDIKYNNLDYDIHMNSIYKEIIDINLYNYYTYYKYLHNEISITNKHKFTYNYYFIYYLYDNLYTCYAIKIIILPYYDERISKKKNFIQYKKIKINTFYNHNLKKINSIDF